jgi:hypothetical protein
LLLWPRDRAAGGEPIAVPFRCGSRRCDHCARGVAREDFRRIALGAQTRPWWLYLVLTFDPSKHASVRDAFADAYDMWDKKLKRRLERLYGPLVYVQTWEGTRAGWPHVNVLLSCDRLQRDVEARGIARERTDAPNGGTRAAAFPRLWRRHVLQSLVVESGFGMRVWAEVIDVRARGSTDALASYFAKVAGEFVRAQHKAGDQRPMKAPRGFRALRSSYRLLPPRKRDAEWTGALSTLPVDAFVDRRTGAIAPTWEHVDIVRTERAHVKAKADASREVILRSAHDAARAWNRYWARGAKWIEVPANELRAF